MCYNDTMFKGELMLVTYIHDSDMFIHYCHHCDEYFRKDDCIVKIEQPYYNQIVYYHENCFEDIN